MAAIDELIRKELDKALARPRYGRRERSGHGAEGDAGVAGHRRGSRTRSLTGTFGKVEITVPRARLEALNGKTSAWKSQALRAWASAQSRRSLSSTPARAHPGNPASR